MLERGIEFHMVSRMTGNGVSTQEGDGRGDQWKHDSEYCEHAPSPQSWLQKESCASLQPRLGCSVGTELICLALGKWLFSSILKT